MAPVRLSHAVAVAAVAALAVACSAEPDDIRETAPCGLVVDLLAEADPNATEDEVAATLGEDIGDDPDLAETCSAMAFDLCEGPTSQTFDKPLARC